MTKSERIVELKRLREFLHTAEFCKVQPRRDAVSRIAGLLTVLPLHVPSAQQAAHILAQERYSSAMYERMLAQMDTTLGQAIVELETSEDDQAATQKKIVSPVSSTPHIASINNSFSLDSSHDPLWYWHHCSFRFKWWLIGWALFSAALVFGSGFASGRNNLFVKLWDTIQASVR